MRGQGRAGGGDEVSGRACLGLDPHGKIGDPAREAALSTRMLQLVARIS